MRQEPVVVMGAVKAVLTLLAVTGVVVVDDRLSQAVISVVWALVTLAAELSTRSRVTPWPPRSSLDRNR